MICATIKLMFSSMIWWYAKFLNFVQCKFLQVLDDKGCSCYITTALVYTAGVMINSHILDSRNNHQVFFYCFNHMLFITCLNRQEISITALHWGGSYLLLLDRCLTLQDFTSTDMKLKTESNSIIRGKTNSWSDWKEMIMSWQKIITRSWNSQHKKNAY
jgi:hypothetical protein